MLTYDLMKNHAGILLCGDHDSLQELHEVVHEVNEESVLIKDKEGLLLAFAYDVRKAFEGGRRIFQAPEGFPERGVRYGVEILWPVVLLQCSILRAALAFFDSTKLQQAMTFALEDVLEAAIAADFGANAPAVLEQWRRLDSRNPSVEEKLHSRGAQFCMWTKAQRKAGLAGLIASLDPLYPALYQVWVRNGGKHLVSPEELDALDGVEWVDPRG